MDNNISSLLSGHEEYMSRMKLNLHPVALFGIKFLDAAIGGFYQSSTTLVYAPTNCGKSTLANRVAASVLEQGKRVVIFSLETDAILRRGQVLATMLGESANTVRKSMASMGDKFAEASEKYGNNLLVCDFTKASNIENVRKIMLANVADIVIYDQLTTASDGLSAMDFSKFAQELANLSYDTGIPILAVSQSSSRIDNQAVLVKYAAIECMFHNVIEMYKKDIERRVIKCHKIKEGDLAGIRVSAQVSFTGKRVVEHVMNVGSDDTIEVEPDKFYKWVSKGADLCKLEKTNKLNKENK